MAPSLWFDCTRDDVFNAPNTKIFTVWNFITTLLFLLSEIRNINLLTAQNRISQAANASLSQRSRPYRRWPIYIFGEWTHFTRIYLCILFELCCIVFHWTSTDNLQSHSNVSKSIHSNRCHQYVVLTHFKHFRSTRTGWMNMSVCLVIFRPNPTENDNIQALNEIKGYRKY